MLCIEDDVLSAAFSLLTLCFKRLVCASPGVSTTPGLCPLEAGNAPSPRVVLIKNVPRHCLESPGEKSYPVENWPPIERYFSSVLNYSRTL